MTRIVLIQQFSKVFGLRIPLQFPKLGSQRAFVYFFYSVDIHIYIHITLLLLPSIFPSTGIFSSESALCIRWPKYWSFSFSISPSNEHSGLISFRMDWLDLLAFQGTLKSLPQHNISKASILWCSAFFTVQLAHPYMTTGKP